MAFIENSLTDSTVLNLPATPIAGSVGTMNLFDTDRFTLTQSRQVNLSLSELSTELPNDTIGRNSASQEQVSMSALGAAQFFDVSNGVYASAVMDDRAIDYPGKVYENLTMEDLIKRGEIKGVELNPELVKFMDELAKRPAPTVVDPILPGVKGPMEPVYYPGEIAPGTGIDPKPGDFSEINPGRVVDTGAKPIILEIDPDALIGGPGGMRYSDLYPELPKDDKPDSSKKYTPEEIAELYRRGEIAYSHAFPAADLVVGIADFNQDGQRDLLLRNRTTGEMQFWYMNGTNKIGEAPLVGQSVVPDSSWEIEGVGDFNGDGRSDIVWRGISSSNTATVVWYLNNNAFIGGAEVKYNGRLFDAANGFRIDGVADFNGDGQTDILWRNYTNSSTFFWNGSGGFNFTGGTNITPANTIPTTYTIEGVGDFNGDGVRDIFWREHPTGSTIYWQMNAGYQSINAPASGYISLPTTVAGGRIEQVGDVNADNRPDIVWKMPNGSHIAAVLGVANVAPPPLVAPISVPSTPLLPGNNTSPGNTFVGNTTFHTEFGHGMIDTTAAIAFLNGQAQPREKADPSAINQANNSTRQNEIVNLPEVWNQTTGQGTGQGVIVAVIDDGVMLNHPDLDGNIWINAGEVFDGLDNDGNGFIDDINGWDFMDNDRDPAALPPLQITTFPNGLPATQIINNHGTQVAGMIAAELAPNGANVTGGAYNARIMAVRAGIDQSNGFYDFPRIANAIRYAANNGARVINLSLGGGGTSALVTSAITDAVNAGAVVVISAGNGGGNTIDTVFPAVLAGTQGVIAVGATNAGNLGVASSNSATQVAAFSTGAGNTVRNYVMAPGMNTQTTSRTWIANGNPNNGAPTYDTVQGTSFAAPLVAAAVATIRQAVPGATPAQVVNALTQTADSSDIYI
jgi:subtilisin family serine protease